MSKWDELEPASIADLTDGLSPEDRVPVEIRLTDAHVVEASLIDERPLNIPTAPPVDARKLEVTGASGEKSVSASGSRSIAAQSISGGVIITGDAYVTQVAPAAPSAPFPSDNRRQFFDEFLRETQRQAASTFRLSLAFTILGGLIVLGAGILALVQAARHEAISTALLPGLTGALIAGSGAAIAARADKTRKYLGEQAHLVHEELRRDASRAHVDRMILELETAEVRDQVRMTYIQHMLGSERRDPGDPRGEAGKSSPQKPKKK